MSLMLHCHHNEVSFGAAKRIAGPISPPRLGLFGQHLAGFLSRARSHHRFARPKDLRGQLNSARPDGKLEGTDSECSGSLWQIQVIFKDRSTSILSHTIPHCPAFNGLDVIKTSSTSSIADVKKMHPRGEDMCCCAGGVVVPKPWKMNPKFE